MYGIVKQFDGYVFVDSNPGEGTIFQIFLPQHEADAPARPRVEAEDEHHQRRDLTGHGTILLVEDEDAVRMFGARALRNKGYTVLEADSGESALELLKSAEQTIDLLVTDVVMPRMDGPTLAEHVRNNRPDIKVIYISGYAEDAFRSQIDETINFLPKPFSLGQLAARSKVFFRPPRFDFCQCSWASVASRCGALCPCATAAQFATPAQEHGQKSTRT